MQKAFLVNENIFWVPRMTIFDLREFMPIVVEYVTYLAHL